VRERSQLCERRELQQDRHRVATNWERWAVDATALSIAEGIVVDCR
jgi:hypothetical protein